MTKTKPQLQLPRVPSAKQGRVTQRDGGWIACWKSSQESMKREAADLCLTLNAPWIDPLSLSLDDRVPTFTKSHQLESRMRKIRPSGLEGGVAARPSLPLSYASRQRCT